MPTTVLPAPPGFSDLATGLIILGQSITVTVLQHPHFGTIYYCQYPQFKSPKYAPATVYRHSKKLNIYLLDSNTFCAKTKIEMSFKSYYKSKFTNAVNFFYFKKMLLILISDNFLAYRISSYSFHPCIVSAHLCTVTFEFPN